MRCLFLLALCGLVTAQEPPSLPPLPASSGVVVRLSQRAVHYVTALISDGLPQLLETMVLPEVHESGSPKIDITDIVIRQFKRPDINATFVDGKGFRARIHLPLVEISAHFAVEMLFAYEDNVLFTLRGLDMNMELHYTRDEQRGRNIIEVPVCALEPGKLDITVHKDSDLAGMESIIDVIQSISVLYTLLFRNTAKYEVPYCFMAGIVDKLKTQVCGVILNAFQYVDEQNVQATVAPTTAASPSETTEAALDPIEFGSSLCQAERLDSAAPPEEEEESSAAPAAPALPWGVNTTLTHPPTFTAKDVVFGVDGGVLLGVTAAVEVRRRHIQLDGHKNDDKMVGIYISEYVPNTLLAHVFDKGMGRFQQRFDSSSLPKLVGKMAKMACAGCYLEVTGNLTHRPVVEIDSHLGARISLEGNVSIVFQGRQNLHHLIHADTKLHVTVKPSIRNSRVYGDVSLTSFDVNVKKLGLSGALSSPFEKAASLIVPRALWPQVKKRLRFAINKRGVKLPVMCGLELQKLSLGYVNGAAVLDSDLSFDLDLFVRKFKAYLDGKLKRRVSGPLPRYLRR